MGCWLGVRREFGKDVMTGRSDGGELGFPLGSPVLGCVTSCWFVGCWGNGVWLSLIPWWWEWFPPGVGVLLPWFWFVGGASPFPWVGLWVGGCLLPSLWLPSLWGSGWWGFPPFF